jgi:hypothetical protein
VRCWHAMSANVAFSYHFSPFPSKVVLAAVKVLFQEVPIVIMVKS